MSIDNSIQVVLIDDDPHLRQTLGLAGLKSGQVQVGDKMLARPRTYQAAREGVVVATALGVIQRSFTMHSRLADIDQPACVNLLSQFSLIDLPYAGFWETFNGGPIFRNHEFGNLRCQKGAHGLKIRGLA